ESEIWADADQLIDAARRPGYSQLTVRLRSPSDLSALRSTVDVDPRFNLQVKREDTYYQDASGPLAGFVRALGTVIAVFFAFGATAGCLFASFLGAVSFSTVNFSSFTEIKFRFHFAPAVAAWSTLFAVAMGLLGGALPATRAARLAIAEATKG